MGIDMKINNKRSGRSLVQFVWEMITGLLRYRTQWQRLRKRGQTPNYLYLKGGIKNREASFSYGLCHDGTVAPPKEEALVARAVELHGDAPPEQPPISIAASGDGESAAQEDLMSHLPPGGDSPEGDAPEMIDGESGQFREGTAIADALDGDSAHHKEMKETTSPKKTGKNSGAERYGQKQRSQMPLPFE